MKSDFEFFKEKKQINYQKIIDFFLTFERSAQDKIDNLNYISAKIRNDENLPAEKKAALIKQLDHRVLLLHPVLIKESLRANN